MWADGRCCTWCMVGLMVMYWPGLLLPAVPWWDFTTWWCHQMETFSVLLALCAGNSPVTGEFLAQGPVTQSFDVFFELCLNKGLSTQLRPRCPLKRHCNEDFSHLEKCHLYHKWFKNEILVARVVYKHWFPIPWSVGNKHQSNTRASTETVHYDSAFSILFLTHYYEHIDHDQ